MKKHVLLILTIVASIQSYATIVYVNPTSTGNNDGTSWADAYTDLQVAFDNLTPGANDSVFVAEGSYKPVNASTAILIEQECSVFGGFPMSGNPTLADRDWDSFITYFDGDLSGNDIEHDLTQNKGENATRILSVFATGERVVLDGIFLKNSGNSTTGGSAIASSAYLHIYNSRIEDNRNPNSPNGIIRLAQQGTLDSCYIKNTDFFYNYSNETATLIRQESKNLRMEDCKISHSFINEAAIRSEGDKFTAVNCVFSHIFDENGNSPNVGLYAISAIGETNLEFNHCTFNNMNDAILIENGSIEIASIHVRNSYFDVDDAQEGVAIFANHNGDLNMFTDSVATNGVNYFINNDTGDINETGSASFGSFVYEEYDTANVVYKLDCSSEFVDRGLVLANISMDVEGNNRVIGNGPDLGAFESNCTGVGINEVSSDKLDVQIYPNPVSDILNIQATTPIKQVSIFSVTGREMKIIKGDTEAVNTTDLPVGIYFVKINTEEKVLTRKFIKK